MIFFFFLIRAFFSPLYPQSNLNIWNFFIFPLPCALFYFLFICLAFKKKKKYKRFQQQLWPVLFNLNLFFLSFFFLLFPLLKLSSKSCTFVKLSRIRYLKYKVVTPISPSSFSPPLFLFSSPPSSFPW